MSRVLAVCIFCCCFSRLAMAQAGHTELTGQVRDPSGSLIAGAQVAVIETRAHREFVATTGPDGVYAMTHLNPGTYAIQVAAPGFKTFIRHGIHLATGERIRVDVRLEVGNVADKITVVADAPLLRTEAASMGQVISNRNIVDLPLNGRSFISLISLAPGVATPPGTSFPRINGGRPRVNEYLFDGISVLQPEPGQVAFLPVIDAIQEFKVETNSSSAEFGRFNGGVINLTTKSGGNEFHGSVFEFLRNEALNARNLFAPKTEANPHKPLFRRNQFGAVLGGPLVRDKTFFFVDYQGMHQQIGQVRISTVPTLLQRQGIFTEPVSGRVPAIYNPATTQSLPNGQFSRDPFANNTIAQSHIDSLALSLLQRYPLPNSAGTANNYRRVGNERDDQDQFDIKVDHGFTENDQLFGRFSYVIDRATPVAPLPEGSGILTSGTIAPADTAGHAFASKYLHIFNSHVVNEVRVGYTRRSINREGLMLESPPSVSLKLSGIPTNAAFQKTMPTFVIDGFQQLGPPSNANSDFRTDVTEIVDTLSIQRGRHSLKAGLDFRWERLDIVQPPSPTGLFRFSSLFTDLPGVTGTGFSLASFLLGQVQTFSIDLQQKVLRPRARIQEYYVQDDWKAKDRLTANVGLRYTLNFPSTEVDNQGAVFNLATQQLDYLNRNGFPRSTRDLHKRNFGPRLGLAFRLTDRTAVRSAYGLTWIEQAGITTPFTIPQFPFIQTLSQGTLDNISPAFALSSGPSLPPIALTPDAALGQGAFSVDRQLGSGYVQQWNLSIQREIDANLFLEIAYAGSKITHIGIPDTNLNQLKAEQLQQGSALLQRVPNPFFGQIPQSPPLGTPTLPRSQLLKPFPRFTTVSLYRNNVGNSNYHALQLKLEQRLAHGLSFLVSYTRSKLIDEASSVFDASILTGPVANFPVADSFNRRLERDVSNGDIPNVFVASYAYDLPLGPGHRLGASTFLGAVLAGWELTGIVTVQSGIPLAISQATNFNAFAGFGTQRPNRVADVGLPSGQRTTARFFNIEAFSVAPQFTLGSSSRNPVRGPGYRNFDMALIKRSSIREKLNVEFRAEAFNLTNTPPLGNPNVVLGTPGFGSITSAADPRVIQLALKLNF